MLLYEHKHIGGDPQICISVPLVITQVKYRVKEAAVPNMPPRKISWWKNFTETGKNLFLSNLQFCQFKEDGWKNRTFFMKGKLNMNLL